MKTIVLDAPGALRRTDTPAPPTPGPGEALLKIHRIGICGTDLHAFRGKQPFFTYPRILGHELGVEVLAVGEGVANVRPGDRCAVEPYLNCGHCGPCLRGKPNCCANLKVLGVHTDGGMRETITLPARKLHPSSTLAYDQLALVETLGIGAHAVSRAALSPNESVLVIGAGPIGLSVIQFAHAAGATVTVMDTNAGRLDFCRARLNVQRTITAPDQLQPDDPPAAVFDATGNPGSMNGSFQLVAPGGKLVFVGLHQGDVTFKDSDFHRRELTLFASRNSTPSDFTHIIRLMETNQVATDPWITHRTSFDHLVENFPTYLDPANGTIKALIEL